MSHARDDKQERYQDILKKIAGRKPFGETRLQQKSQAPHDRVLDFINAYDSLASLAQRDYQQVMCNGPKYMRGAAWSGVLIWWRHKGYHGYQKLNLLGVWTHYREGEILISIGSRQLTYRAPIYDAGVYRVAIENNFRIYYEDDGRPPGENDRLLYRAPYEAQKRLQQRQALDEIVQQWRTEMESG